MGTTCIILLFALKTCLLFPQKNESVAALNIFLAHMMVLMPLSIIQMLWKVTEN